jgi:hypothetical protein
MGGRRDGVGLDMPRSGRVDGRRRTPASRVLGDGIGARASAGMRDDLFVLGVVGQFEKNIAQGLGSV